MIHLLGGDTEDGPARRRSDPVRHPGWGEPGNLAYPYDPSARWCSLVADVEIDVDCEFDQTGKVYLWGALLSRVGVPDATYHSFGSAASDLDEHAVAAEFLSWLKRGSREGCRVWAVGPLVPLRRRGGRHLRRILGRSAESHLVSATDLLNEVVRPNLYAPAGYGQSSGLPRVPEPHGAPGERG